MKTGNNVPAAPARHGARVRDDSQRQLRDIEELVAKLRIVTKQLQFPAGAASTVPSASTVSPASTVPSAGAVSSVGTASSASTVAAAHGPLSAAPGDEARRAEHAEGEMN